MANKLFVLLCRVHKYINRVDNERFFFENISFFYLENEEDQPKIEWEYVQNMSFLDFPRSLSFLIHKIKEWESLNFFCHYLPYLYHLMSLW